MYGSKKTQALGRMESNGTKKQGRTLRDKRAIKEPASKEAREQGAARKLEQGSQATRKDGSKEGIRKEAASKASSKAARRASRQLGKWIELRRHMETCHAH